MKVFLWFFPTKKLKYEPLLEFNKSCYKFTQKKLIGIDYRVVLIKKNHMILWLYKIEINVIDCNINSFSLKICDDIKLLLKLLKKIIWDRNKIKNDKLVIFGQN